MHGFGCISVFICENDMSRQRMRSVEHMGVDVMRAAAVPKPKCAIFRRTEKQK